MKFSRLILNIVVGLVLAVILAGLCCVIVAERCERNAGEWEEVMK